MGALTTANKKMVMNVGRLEKKKGGDRQRKLQVDTYY